MNDEIIKAAKFGHFQTVLKLLNSGVDVNVQDEYGTPILWWAAAFGKLEVVELLIMRGANVNQGHAEGPTTLMGATVFARNYTENYSEEVAVLLLKHKAEIDARDKSGKTALQWALTECRFKAAKFLLKSGADCSIQDMKNISLPIYIPSLDMEIIKLITEKLESEKNGTSAENLKPKT